MKVCVTARSLERLSSLQKELGDHSLPLEMDVTNEASVLAGMGRVKEIHGGLDVLVNNAGLGYQESLLDGSTARFKEMLDVNILGLLMTTREGIKLMEGREEGHVFQLGSMAGHRIAPGSNLYGATKYAVRALTESLRQELHASKRPIRVSSVSPGFVETKFHQRYFDSEEKSEALYSAQKVLEPGDIADAVLYALGTPEHVAVHDLLIRSRYQST